MSWRAVLKAGLGLLLALPFLWLLQFAFHEAIQPPRPEEARFSPMMATTDPVTTGGISRSIQPGPRRIVISAAPA